MAVYRRQQNRLAMLDGEVNKDLDDDPESGQDLELSTCNLRASLVDHDSPIEGASVRSLGGLSGICLPRSLRYQFAKQSMEPTYQAYFNRVRRDTLHILVLFAFLYDVQALILYIVDYSTERLLPISIMGIFAIVNFALFCLCKYKLLNDWTMTYVIPYGIWIVLCAQTFVDLFLYYKPLTPSDGVGWQTFFIFASFTMMPLRLTLIIILCLCSAFTQCMIVGFESEARKHMGNQITANLLLYFCAMIVGIISFLGTDRKQRRAFIEMKKSLENKLVIEEQSAQQEGLLLSVLPKHVADAMMIDAGKTKDGAFNRIYIKRHENISILFADIVGFTAMSSKMSAPELVKTLNALFANFDRLSDKNHQLRIKILGDCYYCICGVPDEIPDHAACTITMGLDMVVAIAAVREQTKSGVDMRVGIHTGAVLAGVMGQKRWQFDVWSTDVKLANCMESGGVPGRVHISQATYDCLNGEFQVEPGDGGSRDDFLKIAGVVTYLVLKPTETAPTTIQLSLSDPESPKKTQKDLIIEEIGDSGVAGEDSNLEKKNQQNAKEQNGTEQNGTEQNGTDQNGTDQNGAEKDTNGKTVTFADDNEEEEEADGIVTNKKLYEALVERETDQEAGNALSVLTLSFKNKSIDESFHKDKERQSAAAFACSIIILVFSFCAQLAVLPRGLHAYLTFAIATSLMSVIVITSSAPLFPSRFPKKLIKAMNKVETTWYYRNLLAAVAVTILSAADLIDMLLCETKANYPPDPGPDDPVCLYARYFNFIAILVLIGITVMIQITHVLKVLMMMVLTTLYVVINYPIMPRLYDRYDDYIRNQTMSDDFNTVDSKLNATLQLVVITGALLSFTRHLESVNRMLFYYKYEAKEQKEHVATMRIRNENLVLNIMPAHVAKHFLNQTRSDDQMYAQDYKECGVMFASIPNFSDFYTEDAINNQGTECLRFLNEIISDFDDLLNLPKFKNVNKIKTINSTYMAASGMYEDPAKQVYNTEKERWQHFCDLVEFGWALRDTVEKINMQSFNNFVMRIGLNTGPLLAGVIGARKPHYDIWGNTVNVASRMDGTGKAGHIQVVEEVMTLLKSLYGFTFEQRGLVKVKGKGQLMTYYLIGREDLEGTPLPGQI